MTINDEDFANVMAGLGQAADHLSSGGQAAGVRVHVPDQVDVRGVRARLGLSQASFAARFGFSRAAVTDWEQGRRRAEAAARVLLKVIDREPEAVSRALAAP